MKCKNCIFFRTMSNVLASMYEEKAGIGYCDFEGDDFEILSYASDDTGLMTDLKVSPDFGCMKFQENMLVNKGV